MQLRFQEVNGADGVPCISVAGVIGYELRTNKRHLRGHGPALKLFAFKGVVILQAIQDIIFQALAETRTFFPTAPFYTSYFDFSRGIPGVLFLWEITVMALLFLKAFNAHEYRDQVHRGADILRNPVAAFLSAFVPTDFSVAFISVFSSEEEKLHTEPAVKEAAAQA
jgi:hypothetical protein